MEFRGLAPWPQAVPVVEVASRDATLDLHNCADFTGVCFDAPESLTLAFLYSTSRAQLSRGEGDRIELRFHAVRNLVVRQAPDFDARVVRDLEGWVWQDAGDGWGRLEFRFGDLVVAFRARAVELVS
jgi:hypothetical protein